MQTISDEQLEKLLALSPDERITREYIISRIKSVKYIVEETTTICLITLDNGFRAIGEATCVNAANYNKLIGEKVSYDNAFGKLWGFLGFLLCEKNMLRMKMLEII